MNKYFQNILRIQRKRRKDQRLGHQMRHCFTKPGWTELGKLCQARGMALRKGRARGSLREEVSEL